MTDEKQAPMEVLLTEAEIKDIWLEVDHQLGFPNVTESQYEPEWQLPSDRAIAKAQAVKLVEYIEQNHGPAPIYIGSAYWRRLKKDLGIPEEP